MFSKGSLILKIIGDKLSIPPGHIPLPSTSSKEPVDSSKGKILRI